MLNYNEIKRGKIIRYNDQPYRVLTNSIMKKNRNKPTNQTKLKSLISGKTIEITFHASDKVEEAEIEKQNIKYLYQKKDEVWFCSENDPSDRFNLHIDDVKDQIKYLKTNDITKGLYFDDDFIGLEIPIKVSLKVKTAPDAVKGNTSSGATKKVVLENGLEVQTPLFVKEGDTVVLNTDTGEYTERII